MTLTGQPAEIAGVPSSHKEMITTTMPRGWRSTVRAAFASNRVHCPKRVLIFVGTLIRSQGMTPTQAAYFAMSPQVALRRIAGSMGRARKSAEAFADVFRMFNERLTAFNALFASMAQSSPEEADE